MSHVSCCGGQARAREKGDPPIVVVKGRCPLCEQALHDRRLPAGVVPFVIIGHTIGTAEDALIDHCDFKHGPQVPAFDMTFEETNQPGKPITRRIHQ